MLPNPRFYKMLSGVNRISRLVLVWGMILVFHASSGWCAPVDMARAQLVARNLIRHHLSLYGDWNGSKNPSVNSGEAVIYEGQHVAYNFTIQPSGHVLVAMDDALSPVPLYSTTSAFHPRQVGQAQSIESWIIPEQFEHIQGLAQRRRAAGFQINAAPSGERIARAWDLYSDQLARNAVPLTALAMETPPLVRSATAGPLISTVWGQDSPFNLLTPDNGCNGGNTLTGCVATAWAQVLNYWQWPMQGAGSHAYSWNDLTLSVDFSASTYDWANMGDTPDGTDTTENMAISKLIYDLGIAAETDFGCNLSESGVFADDVLDIFFKYKAMSFHDRYDYTADAWFALFRTELDAVPVPRPVILSIFSALGGGHEVVVDGYQTDPTNKVHINFGWPDLNYNGFYDVTHDFSALYTWYGDEQYLVTGIEPNTSATLPVVTATCDVAINEGAGGTLSGSAVHEGHTIQSYQWRRVDEAQFPITNFAGATATFTAPSVLADTTMVFRLKAMDDARNVGYDQCTVTVRNTDGSIAPPTTLTGDGGGGGGGCFITSLK